jgi:hypothetical protein
MPLASPKYPFEEWAVKGAPEDPGVYALYTGNTLVCIGVAMARRKDDHIRARLLEHFKTNRHGITQYQWEITPHAAFAARGVSQYVDEASSELRGGF